MTCCFISGYAVCQARIGSDMEQAGPEGAGLSVCVERVQPRSICAAVRPEAREPRRPRPGEA